MEMKLQEQLGFYVQKKKRRRGNERQHLIRYIKMKLLANGLPCPGNSSDSSPKHSMAPENFLANLEQRLKLLGDILSPADKRIESFLENHFSDVSAKQPLQLPRRSVILDRHGLAREMSLPFKADDYQNALVSSYRVRNGVLHNPLHDRRTTKGTFHVAVGGLPIPADKIAVPKRVFAELFRQAVNPPDDLLSLPFTDREEKKAKTFVSLLLRPLVCPEVPGVLPEKTMEIRFFAPGALVSNLDFVESIFGNAGDPFLAELDAGLDVEHWSGHTGCVILAPHLTKLKKRAVGLPHYDDATENQRVHGMCWKDEREFYNDGSAFKLTCRTDEGVIVTLIADNYFGYCKKEVKTQISYATNLAGKSEEEHAGGAIAFASFNLGEEFSADSRRYNNRTFVDVAADYHSFIDVQAAGYGIDRNFPDVIYIPENATATVHGQQISWQKDGREHAIPLLPSKIYITPAGYKLRLEKHRAAPSWRLIGTVAEGVLCHKPCTVSGGGKSEISKSVADYVLHGPIFVANVEEDLKKVSEILDRDYSDRWSPTGSIQPDYNSNPTRSVLDPRRSLGSAVKLLTPSADYSKEYNDWLASIPSYIYALVFVIKRMHRNEADQDWRSVFSVDIVNGTAGHELKYKNRKLIGSYLRVGLLNDQTWRTYKLRQDFSPAQKVQTEDDISVSVVVPQNLLGELGAYTPKATSSKFVQNCEYRLFQRPDDAIHRGLDKQTEADLARFDNFISNFEPLTGEKVKEICNRAVDLSQFTEPMQELLREARRNKDKYIVCSNTPRLVDGQPSKNPRYLQTRPDLIDPQNAYVAKVAARLFRGIPVSEPVRTPVHAILIGRRNNPADYERGFRPLAVYNPIHYQELPELFMDFISALTGKSPSTTGAGSEGALTKGPFNALLPITDLNNALVSYLLTGLAGFSTPAGHIGATTQVDHDISLLIPELWCRLTPEERDPKNLIAEGLLAKVENFEFKGELIPACRLGYRITPRFVRRYLGRIFDNPNKVFDEQILFPEKQDLAAFADGVKYIAEAHQRVAKFYFRDGSIEQACPPLRALLNIMAHGEFEGLTIHDEKIREMFQLPSMLDSQWYRERLITQQVREQSLLQRHLDYLNQYKASAATQEHAQKLGIDDRIANVKEQLQRVNDPEYPRSLLGFLGADPMKPVP
jgi:hypothetical protein